MTHPNLTCPAFEALLPDYLEGTSSDSAVADAELHLASCAECRALVADLREITRQAAVLPGIAPSRDLWPEIEARTQAKVVPLAPRVTKAASWNHFRLGAIAAALVGITALSTWTLATRDRDGDAPPSVASTDSAAPSRVEEASSTASTPSTPSTPAEAPNVTAVANTERARPSASATYTSEIQRLRGVMDERAEELDPATVAILQSSIATIDSAIAEARRALERDPASGFLNQQLNKSLERKLGLLRKAALMPST